MIKVSNAIILAAGRGKRLNEITTQTPKPLIRKDGVALIEHIIIALRAQAINDIAIVTGYKATNFEEIAIRQRVKTIFNRNWENTNNISSLQVALPYVNNTLIVNGDIIFSENPFANNYKCACTYAEYSDQSMDEWLIELDGNQNIDNFIRAGARGAGFYQREVTFISSELAMAMAKLVTDFDPNEYYEMLALTAARKNQIPFQIFPINPGTLSDVDNKNDFESHKLSAF